MTKAEVKDLCEFDPKLQWWAMVLFAELCDYHQALDYSCGGNWGEHEYKDMTRLMKHKAEEFPKLVVQEQLNRAKEHFESLKKEEPE